MAITAVVPVDDIFAVGQKERCDRLCVDFAEPFLSRTQMI